MAKSPLFYLSLVASMGFAAPAYASAQSDCPTEKTLEGRMRIADGELSCEEMARRAIHPRPISPAEKKRIIAAFDTLLVDSPSARWRWGKVVRGNTACVWINSKNRMGGYGGWSEYTFDLKTGEVFSRDELDALLARLDLPPASNDLCGEMPNS